MIQLTLRKALNKAFLKVKPNEETMRTFRQHLNDLFDKVDTNEQEEHNKNWLRDFLNKIFGDAYAINTKGNHDLVIHNGNSTKTEVGVIIEVKKPDTKGEMLAKDKINAKALQQLLYYFLEERILGKNNSLKYLIITDVLQWFIFDAQAFEKHFANDKKLVEQFKDFKAKGLSFTSTSAFYTEIAQPAIERAHENIPFVHFDLRDFQKQMQSDDLEQLKKMIPLYKTLSPEHLLKLRFANDSNSLDKNFYEELLHLIGLHEVGTSKKTIERLPKAQRHEASLLENTIRKLGAKMNRLPNVKQYGATLEAQTEAVALELVITWVNRILFLKLLEAQLITYHKGSRDFAFLNYEKIEEYDELEVLFFEVLAKKVDERSDTNKRLFPNVPYLNSSLFEATELELDTIFIGCLRDKLTLPLHFATVLKDENGKRLTGERNTLDYLFTFLDAYDFASEGTEDIQPEAKTIINAAVLGLIFEKINGYKDGSFFTPGFITMYMCRETLRRAVVQKFNEVKGWNCKTFEDLDDKITDRTEANAIVNSLKICDPAVGSGHFLVSALNEMIALKYDLGILQDANGKRIKYYRFEVENDELVVSDEEEGTFFKYNPKISESQWIQKMLFHEKQTIIENCLFGVDINPNSVKICRLRLWIELLKNAYYKNKTELETLPNIDINIKCGNSLISRFGLDTDLKEVLKKNKSKWDIVAYRNAVATYRNAENSTQKRQMLDFINTIKNDFQKEFFLNDPKNKELKKLLGERVLIENKAVIGDLFEKLSEKDIETDLNKINVKIEKLTQEIEDVTNNRIFENAFEWRFEFPEVLNDEGDFVGFDVVIGNPPYGIKFSKAEITFLKHHYNTFEYQANSYVLFYERGIELNKYSGLLDYITPATFSYQHYFSKIRTYLNQYKIERVRKYTYKIFDDAEIGDAVCFLIKKGSNENAVINVIVSDFNESIYKYVSANEFILNNGNFDLNTSNLKLSKIYSDTIPLDEICNIIVGIKPYQVGKGKPKQTRETVTNKIYTAYDKLEGYEKCLVGRNFHKYTFLNTPIMYLKYGEWLAEPRMTTPFFKDKLIIRQTSDTIIAHFDNTKMINLNNVYNIFIENDKFDLKYLLGLLNSKLFDFLYKNISQEAGRTFAEVKKIYLKSLPIKNITKEQQQPIITLVTAILTQKAADPISDTSDLEKNIDALVYELYGLTEEEIKMMNYEL